jgi:hypothetical protein
MTKAMAVFAVTLLFGSCSHQPLRPFDCKAVLALRLGQSPNDVRALLGKPHSESAEQHFWDTKQVVDYAMRFEASGNQTGWLPSEDVFWTMFFENKLVRLTAFRYSDIPWPGNIGLELGSGSYGQPSPRNGNKPEPVEARIGPAFSKIFRCTPDGELASAREQFEGQIKR